MKQQGTDPTLPAGQDFTTEPGLPDERPGRSVVEGYQLGAVIGRGGMGEVIVAHDLEVGRDVALKRMRSTTAPPELVDRFMREARIQARLDHPAIVPVHEVGRDADGNPYFTMKRVSGVTLAELLARGSEKPQRLLRAFVDVCLAIELAHTRLVVHRDLKPSNLMLGDYGDVYILDWGVARELDSRHSSAALDSLDGVASATGATQAGAILGTPGYIAPEHLRGERTGTAADVYALGAILFEILTGEPLHPASGPIASTLAGAADSPAERKPGANIAPELDAACRDALAGDPGARPTARELADRVQAYLDGDRDHERRRVLAAEAVIAARSALDAGHRAEAIHIAGRALALDPESVEAAELVTALVLEPPKELPPELIASLEASEREHIKLRSQRSIRAYLSLFSLVPALPFLEIGNWPVLVAVFVAATAMAGIQWYNARHGTLPVFPIMVISFAFVMLFSRMTGSLMITPLVACAIVLAIGTRIEVARRPWLVGVWSVGCTLVPVLLEWLGVFAPTFAMTPGGLVFSGSVFSSRTTADVVAIVGGTIGLTAVIGYYALAITRGRRDAQDKLLIQAWQLGQLLPRRASARAFVG
jgi:eukaryotic-like serine/threonine-protein kinase